MPRVKLAVTHSAPFQGRTEEFATVYTYDDVTDTPVALEQLVDAVVNLEKNIYDTGVTFVRAQVWSIGLAPNRMLFTKQLTGTGVGAAGSGYRECAVLCKWPLPRKQGITRTIYRSLKKWHHTTYYPTGMTSQGTGAANAIANGTNWALYRDGIQAPVGGVALCNDEGVEPTGPMTLSPYLEHRQFPKGKKRSNGIL